MIWLPLVRLNLVAHAIRAALDDAGAEASVVQELIMGCVLPADAGQAPARQAGFAAGLGDDVPASTLNKVCGSGMKTVMMAHDLVRAGSIDLAVAGSMESMTNSPYLSPATRESARLGHHTLQDHMFLDGLEDATYDNNRLMGEPGGRLSRQRNYQFSREAQDEFALQSLANAREAQDAGAFERITPVTIRSRRGSDRRG